MEINFDDTDAAMSTEQEMTTQARYHALVQKKYSEGISQVEMQELERLGEELDEENAPFYKPILDSLRP